MKAVLYVKKEKPYLYGMYSGFESRYGYHLTNDKKVYVQHNVLNGKIIAECDFEVEDIVYKYIHERDQFGILHNGAWYEYKELNVAHHECDLASRSGFKDGSSLFDYLFDYLDSENGYAVNTKNLNVLDKPRELSDFDQVNNCCFEKEIDRDWEGLPIYACIYTNCCKYKSDGHTCDKHYYPIKHINGMSKVFDNQSCEWKYIISISPQEACNILNYKQDVLIRRNVLKETKSWEKNQKH